MTPGSFVFAYLGNSGTPEVESSGGGMYRGPASFLAEEGRLRPCPRNNQLCFFGSPEFADGRHFALKSRRLNCGTSYA